MFRDSGPDGVPDGYSSSADYDLRILGNRKENQTWVFFKYLPSIKFSLVCYDFGEYLVGG